MQSEFDGDSRPGSSLTAESSATAHSTATHKHKSPMRRFMHGLKRLNSYSNESSGSSSSEDEDHRNGSTNDQDGSEEFVERHRVQEIRFNYESRSIRCLSSQTSDPDIRRTKAKEVFSDSCQMSPQIRCTLPSRWFSAERHSRHPSPQLYPLAPPGSHGYLLPGRRHRRKRGSHRPCCWSSGSICPREGLYHLPLR